MSDFDKEAEREKLREKYEDDREDREATERMSDLLLKGATMTDTHCGTCGDPIFRHEGQEFCPTCQEVLTEGQEQPTDTADSSGPETGGQADEPTGTPTAETTAASASVAPDEFTPQTAPAQESTAGSQRGSGQPTAEGDQPVDESLPADQQPTGAGDTGGASLSTARASLARTVTRLAQQAEASEDLERARAYLAATEEAADALAAVKRADR